MNTRTPTPDPALSRLREVHRAQRAPHAVRQRAFATVAQAAERVRRASAAPKRSRLRATTGWLLTAGVAAIAAVWATQPGLQPPVDLSSEPVPKQLASAADCARPLPSGTYNPGHSEAENQAKGLVTRTLSMSTLCGPLLRRYLVRVPKRNAYAPPILVVAHGRDESAERAQIATRWWFEDLAERTQAVLVMVQGTEASRTNAETTFDWREKNRWQTDENVHPAVDDFAYLQEVIRDVRSAHALQTSDVVLAGYGSGAVFALAAAANFPDQYAGVAAFLPPRPLNESDLLQKTKRPGSAAASRTAPAPRVFIALQKRWVPPIGEQALLDLWTKPFGGALPTGWRIGERHRFVWPEGIGQFDGAIGPSQEEGRTRIVILPPEVDPFPLPGGSDPLARSASQERNTFFHGPLAAWNFLRWQ